MIPRIKLHAQTASLSYVPVGTKCGIDRLNKQIESPFITESEQSVCQIPGHDGLRATNEKRSQNRSFFLAHGFVMPLVLPVNLVCDTYSAVRHRPPNS